jgi:glucans biosynthesis protein C
MGLERPAHTVPATTAGGAPRIYAIDWLRAFAVLGVFVYHAAHPFDTIDWHIKNAQRSEVLTGIQGFFATWGIGFFFLVAGAASFLALRSRTTRAFVRERTMRLLVPFAAAWVVLSPVQSYYEETHRGAYRGSFVAFVPRFFQGVWDELRSDLPGPLVLDKSYHLWFLVFLFEFSMLGLLVFRWLRSPTGRRSIAWLGDRAHVRGAALLFGIPLAVIHVLVQGAPGDEHLWNEFVFYFDFFVAGYVVLSDSRLLEAVRRDVVPAFIVGAIGIVTLLASGAIAFAERGGDPYSPLGIWITFVLTVQAWAWMTAVFGWGLRVPAFTRPLPSRTGVTLMPFFVLHQPIIVVLAFFVVGWSAAIPVKLLALLAGSFVVTAALAGLAVALPGVSTLLGVKHRRPRVA